MPNGSINSAGELQMDYMNLLIVQLRNQNPLEPMDNSQMTAQLTALGQLEQLENLGTSFQDVLSATQRTHASDMVGRHVSFFLDDGTVASGEVEMVDLLDGDPKLTIGSALKYTDGGRYASGNTRLDELDQAGELSWSDTVTVHGNDSSGAPLNGGAGAQIGMHTGLRYITLDELADRITQTFVDHGEGKLLARYQPATGRIEIIDRETGYPRDDVYLDYNGSGQFDLPRFGSTRVTLDDLVSIAS
jgi:flagellar basal-body rod modification protein FlgD